MDVSVPPVVRGEFVYRDSLFVDVGGDLKRHPRASEAEIKTNLDGKAPKDQVGHWYEAQLIHYGLQRSKEKNTAKVRLQQALSQRKLKVPPHIVDMEAQMKKDYAAAVRKAKTQAKAALSDGKSAVVSKKRKNEEEGAESSKKTKISVSVGGISIDIEHAAQASAKKKASTAVSSAKPVPKKPAAPKQAAGEVQDAKPDSKPANAPKAKAAKNEHQHSETSPQKSAVASKAAKGAKNSAAAPASKTKTKPESKVKPEPNFKPEPKVKSESEPKLQAKVKKEPTIKPAAPVKKMAKVKAEPEPESMDIDSFAQEMPGTHNVTGVYNVSCPQLEDELPEDAENFRLFLCVDNGIIWGGFELGMKSGVIRVDEVEIERTVSFGWRAKDSWEDNRLTFGRGCFGELELYGREQVRGTFHNLFNEPMEFEGRRRPGPLWCGRSPYSFQQEWDGFVTQAYGR